MTDEAHAIAAQDVALMRLVSNAALTSRLPSSPDLRGRVAGIGAVAAAERNVRLACICRDEVARQGSQVLRLSARPRAAGGNANRSLGKSGTWKRSCHAPSR